MSDEIWSLDAGELGLLWLTLALGVALIVSLVFAFRKSSGGAWWALLAGSGLAVGVKSLDLLRWKLPSLSRQAAIAAALGIVLLAVLGSQHLRWTSFWSLVGLWPPALRFGVFRLGRLALGMAAVTLPGVALVTSTAGSRPRTIGLLIAGAAAIAVLVVVDTIRFQRYRRDPVTLPPARVVIWTFTPPWLLLTAGAITSMVAGGQEAADPFLLGDLIELATVTALGEEFIFRGVLLGLALVATRQTREPNSKDRTGAALWTVSLAFGAWHIADAVLFGQEHSYSGGATAVWVAGNVLVTTLASLLVLIPLRLRTGNLAAPVLVHFSANASGVVATDLVGAAVPTTALQQFD